MISFMRAPVLLAIWNAARGGWMTYLALLGIRSLAFSQNNGPYVGIGVDRTLILTVCAMPAKLICIVAGFEFGRIGDVSVTAVAAISYLLVAFGIWRRTKAGAAFGLLLVSVESLILMVCIWSTFTTTLLPEYRAFALGSGFAFLALHDFSAIYLLRRTFGDRFGSTSRGGQLQTALNLTKSG
jgi:hypothetical protein